jgi:Siphovirus ReqiPepy6 Gp37-like protein
VEPYTLTRGFLKQDIIDGFLSVIWTERYYGDSKTELVVPATSDMIKKLPVGTFLGLDESNEVMILETVNIEDGNLKVTGISLLSWLNNRFIRVSAVHEDRYWYISGGPPGWVLWAIIYYMCVQGSPYLNGTINIGVSNPQQLVIPGLGLKAYDASGSNISVGVPYGPVYDAMREIATTFEIGMQITLESATESSYFLGFRSYRGLDRTSDQNVNTVIRFSPQLDSFTNIKELQSIAAFKTLVYAFAPSNPDGLATVPGVSSLAGPQYSGFDLRALLVFAEDITTDMIGGSSANLVNVLNSRARDALTTNHFVNAVDGEIVPLSQFKYGVHYNLGDVIEVQGNSGVVQTSRVTEYIRAQDQAGERAYPTVTMLG